MKTINTKPSVAVGLSHFLLIACALTIFASCSSAEKKATPPPAPEKPVTQEPAKAEEPMLVQSRSAADSAKIEEINAKLAETAILGLPAFQAKSSARNYSAALAKLLEILKSTEIPEGYVVEITGHSNKHPKPSQRKGNKLSVERARLVYEFLVKNGIPKNKLSYRGVASDQYDARLGHDQNRRVTFRLVKVESAGGT